MKLFSPQNANRFVFAVVAKNAREGAPPEYKSIEGGDIDACHRSIDASPHRSCYPYPVGRYDENGRYCTYKPPLENVERLQHGRFCLHPLAQQEYDVYKRELTI